eukprot:6187125-Pleurochrysis_carterae.AAC.2
MEVYYAVVTLAMTHSCLNRKSIYGKMRMLKVCSRWRMRATAEECVAPLFNLVNTVFECVPSQLTPQLSLHRVQRDRPSKRRSSTTPSSPPSTAKSALYDGLYLP